MTTGSYLSGPFPATATQKLHSTKRWSGGNGRTVTTRFTRKSMWNAYEMAHSKFRSTNPNQIGTRNSPNGAITVRTNHSWSGVYGSYSTSAIPRTFPQASFDQLFTAREELVLLSKLRKKVIGHSYDMGVSLAEVDKLAGTVSSTLKNLTFGVVDLLTGRWGNAARRWGTSAPSRGKVRALQAADISGRYLEMRYAWEPVISDVFEASKAFEALSNGPRQKVFKASRRKTRDEWTNTNYCDLLVVHTAQRTYTYEMYEEMSAVRQMGLANPLTVLWERIPYSFVVDWFMPVGSYLSNIGQIPFMKGRWMKTDSLRREWSGQIQATPTLGWYPAPPYPNSDAEVFNMLRTVTLSPPSVPRPTLNVFGAIQGKRTFNAIALAHQVFSRAKSVPFNRGYRSRKAVKDIDALEARVSQPDFKDVFGSNYDE